MIEIEEMGNSEIEKLLVNAGYGHLACSHDDEPYVVPIHYAFSKPFVYIYTTLGKKSQVISENPRVCLQVESVTDNKTWKSVIVYGTAEQLTEESEREEALKSIVATNPTLTPAVSIRWMDNWVRENIEVILRLTPSEMTGRATVNRSEMRASVIPGKKHRKPDVH
jgi:Predicted flavin-nucleotide-binding protein